MCIFKTLTLIYILQRKRQDQRGIVDVEFNLIPRSSNADMLHWPPSWRFAPNIIPNVDICPSQQSAIFSQRCIRHCGDQYVYQQAVDQHYFSNVRFFW